MSFVGRAREISTLERLYATDKFQMPVIYGRRRVGKTSLITHFVEGKPAIFFSARESTERENLVALSEAITRFESGGTLRATDRPSAVFETFDSAFSYIFDLARKQRLIFVIDEYPYLAQSYRAVSSLLQHYIDREHETSRLFLILCGSSMSFMEHQVMRYKSPLYGRRTAQIKVRPFDILQTALLLKGSSPEDIIAWYGVAGGIPLYLEQFDASLSLQDNLAYNALRPDCFLYGEPDSFLQQEVREPARYNAVTRAIANGEGRLSDISSAAGIDRSTVTAYLKGLMELGIVRQEQPIVDANRKKMRYVLSDNLFRFWYRFVPRYLTPLQAGRCEEVAKLIADAHLSTFLGPVFEEVCRQWLINSADKESPFFIDNIGRWWGTDDERKEQAELDIVALCENDILICGDCKWRTKLTDVDVLHTLEHRAKLIKGNRELRLVLFSKSGFTERCREEAKRACCMLVALKDMGLGSE